jgi:hypothetical protein
MPIDHWGSNPSVWDRLVLGNIDMPGVWRCRYGAKYIVDVKKAKNDDGATVLDLGREAIELTLTGQIATTAEWTALQKAIKQLSAQRPAQGGKKGERVFFDIQHPACEVIGIKKVYITLIESPEINKGILTQVIRAVEVAPPIPKKGKANASKKKNVRSSEDIHVKDQIYAADATSKGP